MSRWWSDELRVALCPDRVALLRVRRRPWRRTVVAKALVSCAAPANEADWAPAVGALETALADPAWRGAAATVVVSNHFVHYLLVPWSDEIADPAEELVLAQASFSRTFGEDAARWEIRVNPGPAGAPRVASAVPRGLLDGLTELSRRLPLRVRAIEPFLMTAFNGSLHRLKGRRFWFLAVEPGKACIAQIHGGRWESVHGRRIGKHWQSQLPLLLDREEQVARLDGADPIRDVFCYAPEFADAPLPSSEARPVHALAPPVCAGFSPGEDARFAMAL